MVDFSWHCLQVNGQSLLGATHQEAVKALRGVVDKLSIMVCDGFDPNDLDPSLISTTTRNDSISSIDRDDEDSIIVQKVCYVLQVKFCHYFEIVNHLFTSFISRRVHHTRDSLMAHFQ